MIIMAYLKPGVLLKLLDDMKIDEKGESDEDKKPVLLQIRSIVPVLEEGNLWPNKGFYLKVSDLSHAIYVSLSVDQNEMILSNKLKLGQFIYVKCLEKSEPVPLLKGITPVPGRRLCEGSPEDLVCSAKFLKLLEAPETESIIEKGVILEKNIETLSNYRPRMSLDCSSWKSRPVEKRMSLDCSSWKTRPREQRMSLDCSKIRAGESRMSLDCSIDNDSDTDSTFSSVSSTRISKRRIWNESEFLGVKEIFDSSTKPSPPGRLSSPLGSPVRSVMYDSSDENSSSKTRKRGGPHGAKKLVKKSKNETTKIDSEQTGAETGILWESLPPSFVKLGKEVIRKRDDAVRKAADLLQEACAAEKLLNCLSTFSEFHLVEGDDLQPYVDKFFDLQEDLVQTKSIMHSLTNISPERNENATTWIKSAIAVDLSSPPTTPNPQVTPQPARKPRITTKSKPRTRKGSNDIPLEWTQGPSALQDECRKLFLSYVEKYLDEVEKKSSSIDSDGKIAEMLYRVKKVNDWLDVIVNKNGECSLENPEFETCKRVRNKIYEILLKHVERTAMALENVSI